MSVATVPSALSLPSSWTSGVRREVLSNGLTLLVQRDESAPVVAVVTRVLAGFFDEPDRWGGISHVLEHMFFKGTSRRSVGAIARETKAAGGYLNASTSYDHTSYFTVLPAHGLEAALDIQSDALRHSVIDDGELARELQVIIQEAKRKLDTPGAVAYETLHELMFDRHRIRRWRIGHEDVLAGFRRDDLWGYYRSRYVPSRTVVAIVGDIEVDAAVELAERAYGDWAPGVPATDRSPEEPPRLGVRARTLRGDVTQAELALGWRAVPPLDPDATPLDLAAAVLATGRGSWLYRSLRQTGTVTSVSAHNYSPTELGVFAISADLEPARLDDAVRGIAEAVARLRLDGPSDEDVDRARMLMRARWARQMESMEGRASALAAAEQLEDISLLDREYEALAATSAGQIREAATRYLEPDAVSAVVYLPHGEGIDLTEEALGRSFAAALLPALPPVRTAPVTRRPRVHATGSTEGGVLHVVLPGVDLLVQRKAGVPLVTLGVYVPRREIEPADQSGLGALAVRSAVRGAGPLDGTALAFAFERLGGTLGTATASDWLGLGTTVLSEHLAEAAGLLRLVHTEPRLGEREIEAERGVMTAEAEQVADDMFRFPFQLGFRVAFGNQGYGLPVGGLPDTLPELSASDVRDWHTRALLGARPVVLAVGDVEPQDAADILAGVFVDAPHRPRGYDLSPLAWQQTRGEPALSVVTRDKAQVAFAMIFPGPRHRDPRRPAAQVWAAVSSGLGGRMFEALRDRRSLAYTVVASAWLKARAGALVSYIATSPDREAEARSAMLDELARFGHELVSDAELEQAVNYLAGQAEVARQSAGALVGEILEAWISGAGLTELADPAAAYRRVTREQIRDLARECLVPSSRAEGVVRGTGGPRAS